MRTVLNLLQSKKCFISLVILNFIVGITVFLINRKNLGGDFLSYTSLAEGILNGKYSMYYFLEGNFPDTYRNPGYPIFLAFLKIFSPSIIFVQVIQLIIYFITIIISLKTIDYYFNDNYSIKNLFLSFLLISLNIVILTPFFLAEILMAFLIVFSFYFELKFTKNNYSKFIILGLLYGIIFQVRPIFLFFPLLKFTLDLFIYRKNFKFIKNSISILIYFLTMIPFGLWNYQNHGVFRITSLQGGAEVMNAGYWAQKIPNYYEDRSFGNIFFEELILFINLNDRKKNIENYNKEWDFIDSSCSKYLTKEDLFQKELKTQNKYLALPITYSSNYTIEKENVIKAITLNDILNDKEYVIKSKIYSAIRLWVTGVQIDKFRKATLAGKLILMAPIFLTGFVFLLAIIFIPIAFIKYKILFAKFHSIILIIIYFGLIHIPFVIQARYTIPVRMLLLMVLSVSIYYVLFKPIVNDDES